MDLSTKPNFMFAHRSLDFLFNWRWWAAWVVFIPLTIVLMAMALLYYEGTLMSATIALIMGLFAWTLCEYVLHRFIFHFIGENPWLKHFHYVVHGMHHAYPTDPHRVIFPPFLSIALG